MAVTLLPCIDTVMDDWYVNLIDDAKIIHPNNNAEAEMLQKMMDKGPEWFGIHGSSKKLLKKPKR